MYLKNFIQKHILCIFRTLAVPQPCISLTPATRRKSTRKLRWPTYERRTKGRRSICAQSATEPLHIAKMLLDTRKPALGKPAMTAQCAQNAGHQPRGFDVTFSSKTKFPSLVPASQRRCLLNHRLKQQPPWQNLFCLSSDAGAVQRCSTTAK